MGKIVRYTTEELQAMPDLTDWERVRSMTDEEIDAADTSDEGLDDDWTEHAIIIRVNGEEVEPPHKVAQ
jgi:hypothetical protein